MLTGYQIAIVGGDQRQLELITQLSAQDATLHLFGFERAHQTWSGAMRMPWRLEALASIHALVLPVGGTDETGRIEALYADDDLYLTAEHLAHASSSMCVYTGVAQSYLRTLCETAQLSCVALLQRHDVAIYNSIPTAEGVLKLAIEHTVQTIHDAHIAVVGFGRLGMTICRMFDALGAHVHVGVLTATQFARAKEMGLKPFYTDTWAMPLPRMHMLVNTVPAMVLSADVLAHVSTEAVILDVASSPGGTDFRFAQKRGIKALLAPGLPGLVAPKTAGHILATVLITLIQEQEAMVGGAVR